MVREYCLQNNVSVHAPKFGAIKDALEDLKHDEDVKMALDIS